MRRSRTEGRELLYVQVTEKDELARADARYRAGRFLHGGRLAGVTVAFFAVVLAVAATALWRTDDPEQLNAVGTVFSVVAGAAGALGLYCWWFFQRQERSELRRAYRFRTVEPDDDEEIARAKRVLLTKESTFAAREQAAALLLSRGACSPNRVSTARDLLGYLIAFAVFFLLLVALTRVT